MTVPLRDRAGRPAPAEQGARLAAWASSNSLSADRYDLERLIELKRERVSVILPTREVGETIGSVLEQLVPLHRAGLVDELLVVDADSGDGTAEIAAGSGAAVLQESAVLPELGRARGKGDAMWRGLAATSGEIVVYLDTDTRGFGARFLLGMLGPLLERPDVQFVKGTFRRPFEVGGVAVPGEGGRVTELVARPLLNLFAPELAGFGQPLAGETAGRRGLLESLPYPVGYGVEIAMMIDAGRRVGIEAMAQVDLGTRQNRHQPLRDLSAMALAVIGAACGRFGPRASPIGTGAIPIALPAEGDVELRSVSLEERPPLASVSGEQRHGALLRGRAALEAAAGGPEPGRDGLSPSGSR